jgi:hypothetical protein
MKLNEKMKLRKEPLTQDTPYALEEYGDAYCVMVICDILRCGGYQRAMPYGNDEWPAHGERSYKELPHDIVWGDAVSLYTKWLDWDGSKSMTVPHDDISRGWIGAIIPWLDGMDENSVPSELQTKLGIIVKLEDRSEGNYYGS